jgi:hypothetical protein
MTTARDSRLLLLAVLGLSACDGDKVAGGPRGDVTPIVGADRDRHGCIGSAGYSWCDRTQQCERPWELATRQGFEANGEGFSRFCSSKPPATEP